MNYQAICESNKYLYGHLEQLTYEISFCLVKCCEDEAQALIIQKQGVQMLIDNNLESLEDYWQTMEKGYRPAIRNTRFTVVTGTGQRVIDTFVKNDGNISMKMIAQECGVSVDMANRLITQYIAKKYEVA